MSREVTPFYTELLYFLELWFRLRRDEVSWRLWEHMRLDLTSYSEYSRARARSLLELPGLFSKKAAFGSFVLFCWWNLRALKEITHTRLGRIFPSMSDSFKSLPFELGLPQPFLTTSLFLHGLLSLFSKNFHSPFLYTKITTFRTVGSAFIIV